MRTLPLFLLSLATALLVSLHAFSADIRIVKEGHGKNAISLSGIRSGGVGGETFAATLKSDLERSGWFVVTGPDSASVHVSGSAATSVALDVAWGSGRFSWSAPSNDQEAARRAAHRACDEILRRVLGKQGIASTRIAFVGKRGGSQDLYLCDADGASVRQITHLGAICLSPKWTPDGSSLFYTGYQTGAPFIYRAPVNGGGIQRLANFNGLNAGGTASPDGRLMALILSKDGNPELYILNLSSGNLTRLTRTPYAVESSPSWSPDGRSIAYVCDAPGSPQIYVVNEAKQTRRISFRGSENVAPDWGPDGRIAYCTKQGGYQIAIHDPRDGSTRVITDGAPHEDPSWAPDARHLVCSRGENGRRQLVILDDPAPALDISGDPPLPLFSISGDWTAPDWSER
ncbi:MAG: hypothetical protein ACOX5G_05715 [Kiritimatiellia bacterium]|jgi:TolB protein